MQTGLVLVASELATLVDRWRLATSETARLGAPPHVTILFPWLPGPTTAESIALVRESVRGFTPQTLTFSRVATFPSGVVYLVPEPEATVRALIRRFTEAFPQCPPYGGEFPTRGRTSPWRRRRTRWSCTASRRRYARTSATGRRSAPPCRR